MRHIMKSLSEKESRDLLEKMVADKNIDRIFDIDHMITADTDRALKVIESSKCITIYYDNCYTSQLNVEIGYYGKSYTVHLKKSHDLLPENQLYK